LHCELSLFSQPITVIGDAVKRSNDAEVIHGVAIPVYGAR
jgi:hypothetical protein